MGVSWPGFRRCWVAVALLGWGCDAPRSPAGGADPRQLVENLSVPAEEQAACAALIGLEAAAVPSLQEFLRSRAPDELAERPTALALHVLGQIGAAAAVAQREVQTLFRLHPAIDVRRQATWTLALILAPLLDPERCAAGAKFLRDFGAADLEQGTYDWALTLLALGRDRSEAAVTTLLQRGNADELAALAESLAGGWCDSAVALAHFGSCLAGLRSQGFRTWNRNRHHEGAWAGMAQACWRHGGRSPEIALGLLHHQEPGWRLAGLRNLAAQGDWLAQAAVLTLLADPVPVVQQEAIACVRAWGPALIALPHLRTLAGRGGPFAEECRRTADELVESFARTTGEVARRAVQSADAALRGEAVPLVPASDPSSQSAWIDLVRGSRDAPGEWLTALSTVAPSIAGTAEGADALVGLLACRVDASWQAAVRTVACGGPGILRRCPDLEALIFECGGRAGPALFVGMELQAGSLASEAELATAEAGGAWHLVARARLERVLRGASIPPDAVRRARAGALGRDAAVAQRRAWAELRSCGTRSVRLPADAALVRPAAALLLAAAGETGWRDTLASATAEQLAEAVVARQLRALGEAWLRDLREQVWGW